MAFKYDESEYDKDKALMTMEIRLDKDGNMYDSHGRKLPGMKPIPPADPNKKGKIIKLRKRKKRN